MYLLGNINTQFVQKIIFFITKRVIILKIISKITRHVNMVVET